MHLERGPSSRLEVDAGPGPVGVLNAALRNLVGVHQARTAHQ